MRRNPLQDRNLAYQRGPRAARYRANRYAERRAPKCERCGASIHDFGDPYGWLHAGTGAADCYPQATIVVPAELRVES